jgi:transposase InsO family protein
LHVPNFINNLLSVSQLVDDLNCVVSLSSTHVVLQELNTGRVIGVGKRSEDLYRLKQKRESLNQRACVAETPELELLLLHCRLGHISFIILGKLYPKLYSRCSKAKLVCVACEFAKHTRTTYSSVGNRSSSCFDIVHSDVWGPSRITSPSGSRWFVTFIDCHSRMTWLYLLRSKDEVLECFKIFHKMVETLFEKKVKVLRSDNSTEYTNRAMRDFLRDYGIVHQTTCVSTPEQNGVAERKNRHILEVTRCLLFAMNVSKYLWGEATQTTTYLINRMSLRTVDFSTPFEMFTGTTSFKVPPKKFGCVCFVHNTTPGFSKLDAKSHKCVFVGHSSGKKRV